MDRGSYENVLNDLKVENNIKRAEAEAKRAEAEKLDQEILQTENIILALQTRLAQDFSEIALRTGVPEPTKQTNIDFILPVENEFTEKNQSKISLVSACEKVLQNEGKSLYITVLIEKLKKYGRFTNRRQLVGTIRKDNRFINLGGNVWDLRERHPEKTKTQ